MDKQQMLDMPHLDSQNVVINEEATLDCQNAALERQNAALQEDNEDLRASALWWRTLYEEAQRRLADLESSPKARGTSRGDVRLPRPSSKAAHAPWAGATTRPL